MNPLNTLREAIAAVPAVKYALGVAGVAAAAAIVTSFGANPMASFVATIGILALMVLLVVFAAAAGKEAGGKKAAVLTWAFLLLFIAVSAMVVSSVFFEWPRSFPEVARDVGLASATIVVTDDQDNPLPTSELEDTLKFPAEAAPTWEADAMLNPRIEVQGDGLHLFVQQHEVTNVEFARFDPEHAYLDGEEELPAGGIDWRTAVAYAAWLDGHLPRQAEWEYVAAGECDAKYCFESGEPAELDDVAWYDGNSGRRRHPVAEKRANQRGLYDLYGNVEEWTGDLGGGANRRICGGSYGNYAEYVGGINACSVVSADSRYEYYGLRVAWPPEKRPF